jgi:hypothetical protein
MNRRYNFYMRQMNERDEAAEDSSTGWTDGLLTSTIGLSDVQRNQDREQWVEEQ